MREKHRLTPQVARQIVAAIRAGAFPHDAAEAAGVPRDVFETWLRRGAARGQRKDYARFADAVREAAAQARVKATLEVFQDDPLSWLKHGPGKETPTRPGFSTPIKPHLTQDNRQVNVLLEPGMQGLFAALLQVLAPYPEARAAVARALAGDTLPSLPPHPGSSIP
jgi:hypothetical protein